MAVRCLQLISESYWGQRDQLGINIGETGVVDHAFTNQWCWSCFVSGKCRLKLWACLKSSSGFFGPLINIVDFFWSWIQEGLEKQYEFEYCIQYPVEGVSGYS